VLRPRQESQHDDETSLLEKCDGAELTGSFLPAISIMLGSLLSMTLSIEYTRLAKIQDLAASEAADLSLLTRPAGSLLGTPMGTAAR